MNGNSKKAAQKIIVRIGGCGNELLNYLLGSDYLKSCWVVVDTDAQVLMKRMSPKRIQIGEKETRGLGTNGDAEMEQCAAEEVREKLGTIFETVEESVYLLADLHGRTGLGSTPLLCDWAKATGWQTTLFVLIRGNIPTEEEESILAKWRTLTDELHVWKHKNREPEEKER